MMDQMMGGVMMWDMGLLGILLSPCFCSVPRR
jgi:hypothetical protein